MSQGKSGSGGRGRSGGSKKSAATKFTGRTKFQKVKTARGRKLSSARWLQRQLNDPYVAEAQARGYRSRAAFKLTELDDRFEVLKPGMTVLDLGAAPGGWSQVAAERVNAGTGDRPGQGRVIGIDIKEMDPLEGVTLLHLDFMAPEAPDILKEHLGGPADAVISDMAAHATGHQQTDHLRIMGLCEAAYEFACEVLAPGGVFCAKVLQGGTEGQLLADMKRSFTTVRHAKPPASRQDSAEMYVLASGFRGSPHKDIAGS